MFLVIRYYARYFTEAVAKCFSCALLSFAFLY